MWRRPTPQDRRKYPAADRPAELAAAAFMVDMRRTGCSIADIAATLNATQHRAAARAASGFNRFLVGSVLRRAGFPRRVPLEK